MGNHKSYFHRSYILGLAVVSSIALMGCSQDQKKTLGLMNTPPDEFSVVTRAPLSVPPEYSLRPPRPGAQRPMEMTTNNRARQTLFGVDDVDGASRSSGASPEFLDQIGVNEADSSIRERVDTESRTDVEENRPVAERLMFWRGDDADEGDVLDPKEEMRRLKGNQEDAE